MFIFGALTVEAALMAIVFIALHKKCPQVQSPEGGQGLHDILTEKGRQLRMAGILNGIADEWDPRTDPHIPRNYGLSDVLEGKAHCKRELQKSLGLHEDPGVALMGFCGRLCYQKGVQLITEAIPWLLERENTGVLGRVQLILMGKGDDLYANQLSQAENSNRGRVCGPSAAFLRLSAAFSLKSLGCCETD